MRNSLVSNNVLQQIKTAVNEKVLSKDIEDSIDRLLLENQALMQDNENIFNKMRVADNKLLEYKKIMAEGYGLYMHANHDRQGAKRVHIVQNIFIILFCIIIGAAASTAWFLYIFG